MGLRYTVAHEACWAEANNIAFPEITVEADNGARHATTPVSFSFVWKDLTPPSGTLAGVDAPDIGVQLVVWDDAWKALVDPLMLILFTKLAVLGPNPSHVAVTRVLDDMGGEDITPRSRP